MTYRLLGLLLLAAGLTACGQPPEVDVPVTLQPTSSPSVLIVSPTPMPEPARSLVVCLYQEPNTLYLYGRPNHAADVVLEALYDGPVDLLGYRFEPVILEKSPSLVDGDARIEIVEVTTGDVYLNPQTLQPEMFGINAAYLPAGCHELNCARSYQGGGANLEQMVVEFRLLPGLTWSDGAPLTADDSVFSFQLDAHPDTPTSKFLVDRTLSYEVVDERTVRWTGIPGFLDPEFPSTFWSPLPRHVLGGIAPVELLTAEPSARRPIGWGPYVLEAWEPGVQLVFSPNPAYFRSAEGLPEFETLVFRMIEPDVDSAAAQVLTGECDVLDEAALTDAARARLLSLQGDERAVVAAGPGSLLERMEFNLAPQGAPGPALLRDARTRRGLAACINRQGIAESLLLGFGEVPDSFLSPSHPLYAQAAEPIAYDAAEAARLLAEAGWTDPDGDASTPRIARGVTGVPDGTLLAFLYLTPRGAYYEALGARLQADLSQCGAQLTVEQSDPEQFFAAWPDGPAFGRRFETLGWAWPIFASPPCEMFLTREIPSETAPFGVNASGFSNGAFDQACTRALLGPPGSEEYRQAVERAQLIFSSELPALPLFVVPRVFLHAPDLCGLQVDPSALTILWNLEELARGQSCPSP